MTWILEPLLNKERKTWYSCLRLDFGHAKFGLKVLACLLGILRVADQLNDRVEIREGDQVAVEDFQPAGDRRQSGPITRLT